MSLENYFKNGWLKKEATSPQEIADQLGLVSRCMKDASVQGISDDLRFYTTFNAVLALANTALRASGYRTTTQPRHHMRTIETLEYTVQADNKTIRKIMAFSKKRNVASYDSAGSILKVVSLAHAQTSTSGQETRTRKVKLVWLLCRRPSFSA